MSKVEAGTIQVPAGNADSHKNGLRKRKLQKSSTSKVPDPENRPWGTNRSGTHSRPVLGPEIENSL